MKRVSDSATPRQQPSSKRRKKETRHLELSPELVVSVLESNDCLHIWHRWLRTCHRNQDVAMTPPVRANTTYPISHGVSSAVLAGKLDPMLVAQMRGMVVIPSPHRDPLASFTAVSNLDLRLLDLGQSPGQRGLSALAAMPCLTRLSFEVSLFSPITNLSWLGALTRLKCLRLSDLLPGSDLAAIKSLDSLETLELQNVEWDPSLWPTLTGLTMLSLDNMEHRDNAIISPNSLDAIGCLVNLDRLTLGGLDMNIRELSVLACFPKLQHLEIRNFNSLSSLSGLAQCTNLRTIVMHDCPTIITDFHVVAAPPHLTSMYIEKVGHPLDLSHLALPPTLVDITFSTIDIFDLSIFADLPCLETLQLWLPTTPHHMSQPPIVWASSRLTKIDIRRMDY